MQVDPLTIAGWITTVVAGLAALGVVGRVGWRVLDGLDDLRDDWRGRPARPGVPAQPGVLERLARQEDALARIDAELHPNGGSSVRDVLNRSEAHLITLESQLGEHLAEHARQDNYRLQVSGGRTTLEHGHIGEAHE